MPLPNIKAEDIKIKSLLSLREAHLILELRRHQFAKFTVTKAGGKLIRISVEQTTLLKEEGGVGLEIKP